MPDKHNAAGAASLPEFTIEAFLKSEKRDADKVPHEYIVQAVPDLVEGRFQFMSSSVAIRQQGANAAAVAKFLCIMAKN